MQHDARIAVGQHMISGFSGPAITEAFRSCVCKYKIGNVILFRDNVVDRKQLFELCRALTALIQAETGFPPLIAIDQEGGSVTRLGADATLFPSAMAVAATGRTENARLVGRITGEELAALGVNFDLAPVVDVNSNRNNPVIGIRSYGDDPYRVAAFATEMMAGLHEGGVLSALKHFPGHGDTETDSHLGLPVIGKTLSELRKTELVPFQSAIDCGAPAVMTAHILFPKIETDNVPATMSRRLLSGLLREEMGFTGLIVSDCMMMDAIAKYFGTVPGTLASFAAGVDLSIISHDAALAGEAVEAVLDRMARGEWDTAAFSVSTDRILAAKADLKTERPSLDTVGSQAHCLQSQRISQEAITLVHDAPFALGTRPAFLSRARTRLSRVGNEGGAPLLFCNEMQLRLSGVGVPLSPDPSEEEIAAIIRQIQGCTSVTVGLYGARGKKGQHACIRAALSLGVPVCAVALGSPHDLSGLPDKVRAIAAYDYDEGTFHAVADVLSGERIPGGTLPVKL